MTDPRAAAKAYLKGVMRRETEVVVVSKTDEEKRGRGGGGKVLC